MNKQRMNISMKNTALLIDTNIVLDYFLDRSPFSEQAEKIMTYCIKSELLGYLACHSLLNIFYIARNQRSLEERKKFLLMLCERFEIIGIDVKKSVSALVNSDWKDFEDGLQIQCAYEANVDYIITRDPKGFVTSKIQALSPEEFLNMHEKDALS